MENQNTVLTILSQVKALAKKYYLLTKKPLGVTGEIAEYEAATKLKLSLVDARMPGYDAIHPTTGKKYQVKGRCIHSKKPGQRMGGIKLDKEWDSVLLVLLSEDMEATAIHEAERKHVIDALLKPGSKARNERGALGVKKFKSIGKKVWPAST